MPDWIIDASAWVLPVLLAITLHEAAHGFVANRFGDDTAKRLGRVTINPLKHIDHFGTVMLPATLALIRAPLIFGYAKPVPVNFNRLSPPRLGMVAVAIAGPATNILLALMSALLLHVDAFTTPEQSPWLFQNLYRSILINCVLAAFNMLPVLPLDGGRVVYALLPRRPQRWFGYLERYGMALVVVVLLAPMLIGVNMLEMLLEKPVFWLLESVMLVTGNGS